MVMITDWKSLYGEKLLNISNNLCGLSLWDIDIDKLIVLVDYSLTVIDEDVLMVNYFGLVMGKKAKLDLLIRQIDNKKSFDQKHKQLFDIIFTWRRLIIEMWKYISNHYSQFKQTYMLDLNREKERIESEEDKKDIERLESLLNF